MSFQKTKRRLIFYLWMIYSRSEKGLDSLVQTVRVFSEDVGMEFGIEKCAVSNGERKDFEISRYRVVRW